MCLCDAFMLLALFPGVDPRGVFGVWRPPLQSVSYSKVNASINYFTGAV